MLRLKVVIFTDSSTVYQINTHLGKGFVVQTPQATQSKLYRGWNFGMSSDRKPSLSIAFNGLNHLKPRSVIYAVNYEVKMIH